MVVPTREGAGVAPRSGFDRQGRCSRNMALQLHRPTDLWPNQPFWCTGADPRICVAITVRMNSMRCTELFAVLRTSSWLAAANTAGAYCPSEPCASNQSSSRSSGSRLRINRVPALSDEAFSTLRGGIVKSCG